MALQIKDCIDLIEDLAYASMVESGNVFVLNPKPVDIRKLLSAVVTQTYVAGGMYRPLDPFEININIEVGFAEYVNIDKCFTRSLYNLLNNVSQLCGRNGCVEVKVSSASLDPDYRPLNADSNMFFLITAPLAVDMQLVDIVKAFQQYYVADMSTPVDGRSSASSSLTFSLSQSLALGWFISFNILQNLGSSLECRIENGMLLISFDLRADPAGDLHPNSDETQDRPMGHPVGTSRPSRDGRELSVRQTVDASVSEAARKHFVESDTAATISDEGTPCGSAVIRQSDQPSLAACSSKKRILIVEDSPICQKVLVKSLTKKGYDYDIASDGQVRRCGDANAVMATSLVIVTDRRLLDVGGLRQTRP